jgi:hypothetical protein
MRPEEELSRINRLIRQFESVYRTTVDEMQRERVTSELKKLKQYREKLESFHVMEEVADEAVEEFDEYADYPFLKSLIGRRESNKAVESYNDTEVVNLSRYVSFFENQILNLLSETKLKLDFKYSMERDSFYHRVENLRRQLEDFVEDTSRIDTYEGPHGEVMRMRNFKKKRNLILEADRFFRRLFNFTAELLSDIDEEGLKCLNSDERISFDRIEGNKYLEGLSVREALNRVNELCGEVAEYLNVPRVEAEEQ